MVVSCIKWLGLALLCIMMNSVQAASDEWLHWQGNNVQLLRGFNYQVGAEQRYITTFEHVNKWRYGDTFLFIDYSIPDQGPSTWYGELSPRFSLTKMGFMSFATQQKDQFWLKDVLLAVNVEKPKGQDVRTLFGIAMDFNVPNFLFFNTHFYHRDNPNLAGSSWQFTMTWNRPFHIGQSQWLFEGFTDLASAEGTSASNQLIVPRLLLDIGTAFGLKNNSLWLGIEYSYWHNKFGISGITESVAQLQIKWQL